LGIGLAMAMGGAFANLGIDSEIGPYSQSRCRNSKWTKNSGSGLFGQDCTVGTYCAVEQLGQIFFTYGLQ